MPSEHPKRGKLPSQAGRFKPRKPCSKQKKTQQPAYSYDPQTEYGELEKQKARSRNGGRVRYGIRQNARRKEVACGDVFFTAGQTLPNIIPLKNNSVTKNGPTSIHIPMASFSTENNMMNVGRTVSERVEAATLARRGEGEEVVVSEVVEGGGIGDGMKLLDNVKVTDTKLSGLLITSPLSGKLERSEHEKGERCNNSALFYDSDSSSGSKNPKFSNLPPQHIPFEPTTETLMYTCQMKAPVPLIQNKSSIIKSPFLDLNKATSNQKKAEQQTWITFKLPTRLPQLDLGETVRLYSNDFVNSTLSNNISTANFYKLDKPVESTTHIPFISNTSSLGYDDTLKDASPGRYGKIVVHKSGKTYMYVGGVKMNIDEGLPCGFSQQAVSIDLDSREYIPLANVTKTLVVTPCIEDLLKK